MEFEWNADKSLANKRKHGIDFAEAQVLWNDENSIEIKVTTIGESRHVVVGLIDSRHWTAVITYRNGNLRLISVRRSRKKEAEIYEKNKNH